MFDLLALLFLNAAVRQEARLLACRGDVKSVVVLWAHHVVAPSLPEQLMVSALKLFELLHLSGIQRRYHVGQPSKLRTDLL